MVDLVGSNNWNRYKNLMRDAHDTFSQDTIVWVRYVRSMNYKGTDEAYTVANINLKGLMIYNDFRDWPLTRFFESGQIDLESAVLQLNTKYLDELGYIGNNGYFKINPGRDKFLHLGKSYKPAGDTPVSQAPEDPLHFYIILQREDTPTGTDLNV